LLIWPLHHSSSSNPLVTCMCIIREHLLFVFLFKYKFEKSCRISSFQRTIVANVAKFVWQSRTITKWPEFYNIWRKSKSISFISPRFKISTSIWICCQRASEPVTCCGSWNPSSSWPGSCSCSDLLPSLGSCSCSWGFSSSCSCSCSSWQDSSSLGSLSETSRIFHLFRHCSSQPYSGCHIAWYHQVPWQHPGRLSCPPFRQRRSQEAFEQPRHRALAQFGWMRLQCQTFNNSDWLVKHKTVS